MDDDSDMEDYGFDYSEDEMEEQDVDVENQYYNSKGLLETEDGLDEALAGFQQVLEMECEDREKWAFKALKQIVKVHFRRGASEDMLAAYRRLLDAAAVPSISRAAAEKKLNSVLDCVGASPDAALLRDFYAATLEALRTHPNDRLWFKTNMKLATLWVAEGQMQRALTILNALHKLCTAEDGGAGDDHKKGTQTLEVIALLIQVHTAQRGTKALKALYAGALRIRSAVPHPRILGVIKECGGKVHMADRAWEAAATDFFEAFKSYDEAGAAARVRCLKYLVLATMLMQSGVDPFDSQEARPYKNEPEVAAMTALVDAYQSSAIPEFERILRTHRAAIMADPFIAQYVEDLLRNAVSRLVQSYSRIRLSAIGEELNIPPPEVESLLVSMLLDGKFAGAIDQVQGVLTLDRADPNDARHAALERWGCQLAALQGTLAARLNAV
ncbi:COP9 signalosome complex subunit 2 [Auxenochlorella protothecoides]|uniref:COP9 signalosome complex subunit 2 n=1 Tax=Auxenochlorella protothecoides TaxID=3075 RepID=A0A087SCF9_AUXPR|nr:COP9 signalosome complex subunit 2 [Auxenochlorella protothecoides]KFM23413.1 COP9 signalosome complex subunit 2 [Auxenochlorella protothecoides]RMZ55121.1 hypothetical protein APUTEX25_005399 [Auxenochlorella protothecoides]|eukprot:RMZ55121.1 hypothetical protein APUTEX25_005399 [Auxenochlorella protothecoides]